MEVGLALLLILINCLFLILLTYLTTKHIYQQPTPEDISKNKS